MIELTRENAQLIADALTYSLPYNPTVETLDRHAAALVAIRDALGKLETNDNYDLFEISPQIP